MKLKEKIKMANLKHVGRLVGNKRKVAVAFRVLPNDPNNCLIVDTANLSDDDHESLMNLIESDAGQSALDLGEAMQRARLRDGSIMLSAFHTRGKFSKVPTNQVELTPNTTTAVLLSEVNEAIAQQQGITVSDLAVKGDQPETQVETIATAQEVPTSQTLAESQTARIDQQGNVAPADGVLTDEDLAAQYRSQADAMFKEAKRLREQAEELVPTKKKKTTTKA
jgi:hypothetical protein